MSAVQRQPIYPFDEWKVVEPQFDYDSNYRDETIFAVGNGFLGCRGGHEEGYSGPVGSSADGTYINGFYDSGVVQHAEPAYGLAVHRQTLINITNGKVIRLSVDGESFQLTPDNVTKYRRELNFKEGFLRRELVWRTKKGKEVKIVSERIASFSRKRLLAIKYSVTAVNFSGPISLVSALDGEVYNRSSSNDPRVGAFFSGQALGIEGKVFAGDFVALKQRVKMSRFALVCGLLNKVTAPSDFQTNAVDQEQLVGMSYELNLEQGQTATLEKFVSYCPAKRENEDLLPSVAKTEVQEAAKLGFDALKVEQKDYMARFWERAFVDIEGDTALVQGLRFNLFHLLQSTGRDGQTNIAAKGVTGEGYEGHYFWDSESYILPVLLHTMPELARSLLEHRYSILGRSRERARELALRGALYAWRTIDGEELSAYFPAGTAQYHINADIAYAVKMYHRAAAGTDFVYSKGAEIVFETARCWLSLGAFIEGKGFCLNCVTGPDEFTALVNNNTYTNLMAKDHLEFAVELATEMKTKAKAQYQKVVNVIDLDETEIAEWSRAASEMYVHYDKKRNLYGQDDSFLEKARWEFKSLPLERRPLHLHFHYLHMYRYQVLKQADLILALFTQGDRFTRAEKVRNYDYYEPICSHDSSLSLCTHSIIAAELGDKKQAYEYYVGTVRLDLDDTHNNVRDGIHAAAMAGSWMGLVYGFGGMRERNRELNFAPVLPDGWKGYAFNVTFSNSVLRVTITKEKVIYRLLSGNSLSFKHRAESLKLDVEQVVERPLIPEVKAVLFDLDGVITDTAEYHYEAWKKLADELRVPFDRSYNERLKGIGRMESLELLLARGKTKYTAEEKEKFATRKNEVYKEFLANMTEKDLLPGVRELITGLRARDIKVGLCSASRNAVMALEKLKITEFFDYVVSPDDLVLGKPDPEVFLACADALGVPYESCVGVEDAAAGITAVKKASMFAIGVGKRNALQEADLVVSGLDHLTVESVLSRHVN